MEQDLRCGSKKHAVLIIEDGQTIIEVKCDSRFCGAQRGVVVLHRFSAETGRMIATEKYKNPERTTQ